MNSLRPSRPLLRLLLAVAWCLCVWGRWPDPQPVGSPEGRVLVSGFVEDMQRVGGSRCRLVLVEVRVDEVALEAPAVIRLPCEALGSAFPGDEVLLGAMVWGERVGSNPGFLPAGSQRRHRWRGRATEPVHVVSRARHGSVRRGLVRVMTLQSDDVTRLYRALLLGDRSGMDPALRDGFVDSGTAHLLAISGLHLAVVGWGLYRLLLWLLLLTPARFLRRLPAAAAAGACTLIWLYVAVIAPSQATRRAAIALTVVLAGELLARRASGRRTLAVAAAALVAWEPTAPLGPSFQLSFAAAGSLVLGWPHVLRLTTWLSEPGLLPSPGWARVTRWFVSGLAASTLTSTATAPLALAWFGQLAPVGVLLNVAAVPLVSLAVVPAGFAWLVCAVLAPEWATHLAWVPEALGGLLLDLVEAWSALLGPSTAAAWPHWAGAAGALAVLFVLVRPVHGTVACSMVLLATAFATERPQELVLTALDVGHGDALLLELPGGQSALVDTGGRIGARGGTDSIARHALVPALTRRGVQRLDLLVITHADADHVGAAAALLQRVSVGEVWLPSCSANVAVVERLARLAGAAGAVVRVVRRGRPFFWGGVRWRPLWPTASLRDRHATCHGGRNHGSLVLSVSWAGRRVLLTGDVDTEAEELLVRLDPAALRADVLKVAHHGSRTSTSPTFLRTSSPEVALVSGVPRAGPMPPHQSVLTRLHRAGARTWITGRDGAIRVHIDRRGTMRVVPRFGSGAVLERGSAGDEGG